MNRLILAPNRQVNEVLNRAADRSAVFLRKDIDLRLYHGTKPIARVIILCLATVFGGGFMSNDADATMPDRAVIIVSCPGAADPHDALCLALSDTLAAEQSVGAIVRRVELNENPSLRDGDIFVAVLVDDQTDTSITAHLEWRAGTSAVNRIGPSVQLDVMDTTLSPNMLTQLTRGLVQVDPALTQALHGAHQQ